jgi:glucose-1-phosphate adenylyltransferase
VRDVTAVILGGGRGTRLYPLTLERAKPAVGFAGKYRLIDIPISNCINSGVKRVFVLTQFLSASLHRHIMQTYQFDTFTDGFVDILAAEQTPQSADWYQGTADAVRATLNHTTYYEFEQMLVLSGDHLYRMDYRELVRFHRAHKADITLCVHPVSRGEAPRMGLLRVNEERCVEEFVEKPSDDRVNRRFIAPTSLVESMQLPREDAYCLGSMGVYLFEPTALRTALADAGQTDFGGEVIPSSIGRFRIMAYPFAGYWQDIGTVGSFFESNLALARRDPSFKLYEPGWPIYTRTRSLPPSRVIGSEIRDSLLVEGSDIVGATIQDSIVGMRSVVRENTILTEVVMLGADYYDGEPLLGSAGHVPRDMPPLGVGKGCVIERAIIDKNTRIGDGVIIKRKDGAEEYRGETHWVRDGITVIPKGAVIPPGTVV